LQITFVQTQKRFFHLIKKLRFLEFEKQRGKIYKIIV